MLVHLARAGSSSLAAVAVAFAVLTTTALDAQAPDDEASAGSETWWAYRPIVRPATPEVVRSSWVRNPIDAFVLRRLEAAGLRPAPPADKVTLLRRATYDLTGLPPTSAQVDAFLADDSPDAFERVVDRLLASPQYGVKWARHWLDLVRFAETDSYERDRKKPFAWRYRDWVIDSLNRDKPYDRYLLEQLAGDELDDATVETITATGYYRLGIWDDEPTDREQAVYDHLDDIVDTTARVMLGMSMGCARCHDHKKDPIPQRDYYRMLAFFEGIQTYRPGDGNVRELETTASLRELPDKLRAWREQRRAGVQEAQNIAREVRAHLDGATRRELDRSRTRGIVTRLAFQPAAATVSDANPSRPREHSGALHFDGGDDEVRIARPVQDDFTISFWFRTDRPDSSSDDRLRWFTGSGLVDGEVRGIVDDFGVALVGDHVAAGTGNPETFVASSGGYADGEWHHVAFTRHRASGAIALYVDGDLAGKATGGKQALDTPPTLTVGRLQLGTRPFVGEIDDVRIYDRTLGHQEALGLCFGLGFEPGMAEHIEQRIGKPEADRYRAAIASLVALRKPSSELVRVLCVAEDARRMRPSHVLIRGNVHARGKPVAAGLPAVVGGANLEIRRPALGPSSGRRRAFAEWLVGPDNPLTARVAANRLWQYHFGRGIVRTPNDFGRLGQRPTHLDLLDWLATELSRRSWSLKAMHRLIMSSATYRMASTANPTASAADPRNDLFWRFDLRRLSAEELRDSILLVNGTLNLQTGGPSIYPPIPEEVLRTASRPGQAWGKSPPDQAARRSVYIHVKRSLLMPLLTVFDLADTDSTCAVRFVTTQPTQALTMLNSPFIQEQAAKFAERLAREAPTTADRVAHGLELVTSRTPDAAAVQDGIELIAQLQQQDGLTAARALECYCLVLLNLNEFTYLD